MLFMFLLRRFGGRPMLVGTLLFGCGIALVVVWALTGPGLGGAVLVRYGILCTLIGAGLIARAAYHSRRQPPATPAGDPQEEEEASRR